MGQKVEWLDEDWEKPQRKADGGYKRKGKRTTRTYRKMSSSGTKTAYVFTLGILAAAVLNFLAVSLR